LEHNFGTEGWKIERIFTNLWHDIASAKSKIFETPTDFFYLNRCLTTRVEYALPKRQRFATARVQIVQKIFALLGCEF